jgi:predicted GIY-YIG superfamily endonuclease
MLCLLAKEMQPNDQRSSRPAEEQPLRGPKLKRLGVDGWHFVAAGRSMPPSFGETANFSAPIATPDSFVSFCAYWFAGAHKVEIWGSSPHGPTIPAMAAYFYILQSQTSGKFYVGSTDDLDRRLSEHARNHTPSNRGRGPWTCVPAEEIASSSGTKVRRLTAITAGRIKKDPGRRVAPRKRAR